MRPPETWKRLNTAVTFRNCNDQHVCDACRALEGLAYFVDNAPDLPLDECDNPDGCRCWYHPCVVEANSKSELDRFDWPNGFIRYYSPLEPDIIAKNPEWLIANLSKDGWYVTDTYVKDALRLSRNPSVNVLSVNEQHKHARKLIKSWWQFWI